MLRIAADADESAVVVVERTVDGYAPHDWAAPDQRQGVRRTYRGTRCKSESLRDVVDLLSSYC